MIIELNEKNSKEIKHRANYRKLDYNSFIEEILDNKNRLQWEIYIREERLSDVVILMNEIKENNNVSLNGTVMDEYYELEQEKQKIENEINLLNYLFEELV